MKKQELRKEDKAEYLVSKWAKLLMYASMIITMTTRSKGIGKLLAVNEAISQLNYVNFK